MLHPTFSPSQVRRTQPPFAITRQGWGVFDVGVSIRFKGLRGVVLMETHPLVFSPGGSRMVIAIDGDSGEYRVCHRSTGPRVGYADLSRFLAHYHLEDLEEDLVHSHISLEALMAITSPKALKELPMKRALSLGRRRALWSALEREDGRRASTIAHEDLSMQAVLGQGEFGKVFRASWRSTTTVAVKCLHSHLMGQSTARTAFLKEARLLMSVPPHPNVVACLGVSFSASESFIVTEFVQGGSLDTYLRTNAAHLSHDALLQISLGTAAGMQHLSQSRIVHRDLAARNVLVHVSHTTNTTDVPIHTAKVTDFGLARALTSSSEVYSLSSASNRKIPVKWTAPEAIVKEQFGSKSDVWSFGVLLWEIYSYGTIPYPGLTNQQALRLVKAGGRMRAPMDCPPPIYAIMHKCWHEAPHERPSFKEIHRMLLESTTTAASASPERPSIESLEDEPVGEYSYFDAPIGFSFGTPEDDASSGG